MGPSGVGVGHPSRDQITGMGEVAERRFVQELVPHPAIEAFDEGVLHRLSWRDIVPLDLVVGAPLQDRVRGQFRPIVTDDPSNSRRRATLPLATAIASIPAAPIPDPWDSRGTA